MSTLQHNYINMRHAPAAAQPQADGLVLESQPDRPKSFKQEVTAPLLNARQQVWVSRFLGDDHNIQASRFKVGVARLRSVTAQWPCVPSIGQHLQPFTGNGDVSIWVKNARWDKKNPHNQKNKTYINMRDSYANVRFPWPLNYEAYWQVAIFYWHKNVGNHIIWTF